MPNILPRYATDAIAVLYWAPHAFETSQLLLAFEMNMSAMPMVVKLY